MEGVVNFRNRQRFLRIDPPPKPEELKVELPNPEVTVVGEPLVVELPPAPLRLLAPISEVHFASMLPTRDDCRVCSSRRDSLGRLPIGRCSPDCPVLA